MPTRTRVQREHLTPQALQAQINKHFGKGTITFADDPALEIQRVPTGILSLDYVLNGGFARGRHAEMYGGYSVGKTAISLRTIAAAQAAGGRAAFVDAENTFDPKWARHLGVNTKTLAFEPQREHGQRCIDVMETLLRSRLYDVLVLDSIAALLPKGERDAQMDASDMGTQQARLMSKALRKLTTANSDTVLLYINQQRENVGQMFGNKLRTSGGRAMAFYAGTRLELSKIEDIKVTRNILDPKTQERKEALVTKGHRVLVRVEKDKTGAQPKDQSTFVFDYTLSNIDPIEDLIYLGRRLGYVHRSGEKQNTKFWVSGYDDEKQTSRNRFREWLRINVAVAEDLENMICEHEGEEDGD